MVLTTLLGAGAAVWGYGTGSGQAFYTGVLLLIAGLGPLAFGTGRGRWPPAVLRACSAGALVLLAFLALELAWSAAAALSRSRPEATPKPVYSYAAARADPQGFRRWWKHSGKAFRSRPILMEDPLGLNPFVLKPGSQMVVHESRIRINELGFRGREISREKGAAYRIVALGESTTFGLTLFPGDRPWPELLEERIRAELDCSVPVEVVNAGVPGWTLANQLRRLEADILPLDPDLIVTYHGYNGFHYFLGSLPVMVVDRAPAEVESPSRLLGRAESMLAQRRFRRRYEGARELATSIREVDLETSRYARLYRRLARYLDAPGIALAVSTFNMAVNENSADDVVRFYEQTFPDTRARILANRLHSRLVREVPLGPGVVTIDTSDGLDGAYAQVYLDVVHFNQEGRERLARNILQGIRKLLARDPRPGCSPD